MSKEEMLDILSAHFKITAHQYAVAYRSHKDYPAADRLRGRLDAIRDIVSEMEDGGYISSLEGDTVLTVAEAADEV